jgi:hypothetical protein
MTWIWKRKTYLRKKEKVGGGKRNLRPEESRMMVGRLQLERIALTNNLNIHRPEARLHKDEIGEIVIPSKDMDSCPTTLIELDVKRDA